MLPTWSARFQEGNLRPDQRGTLLVDFRFTYRDAGFLRSLGTVSATIPNALNCGGVNDANDAARTVVKSWNEGTADGCPPVALAVTGAALRAPTASQQESIDRVIDYVTPLIDTELRDLQRRSLAGLLASDGSLTQGQGQASNVAAAAQRLAGAQNLVHGYITLGFPQALATDDALRSLVAGESSNILANPYGDRYPQPEPAANLSGQVASFFRLVAMVNPPQDPLDRLSVLLNAHRVGIERAVEPHVKTGRAPGQDPANGGRISQLNPLVSSTIDRLELTRDVLADSLVPRPTPTPAPTPDAASPAAQPQGAAASPPAASSVTPASAARGRLIRAPRLRGRTVTLTVGCVTGTCRFVATAKAGRRTVTRRFTLAAGRRRTVSLRVPTTRSRTIAVRVTIAGTPRPLTTRNIRRPAR